MMKVREFDSASSLESTEIKCVNSSRK